MVASDGKIKRFRSDNEVLTKYATFRRRARLVSEYSMEKE